MRAESLQEYEVKDFDLTDVEARALQRASGSRLTVTPGVNGWRVRASSYVGAVATPGLTIQINPKVPLANVLYLMTWSADRMIVRRSSTSFEEFDSLVPAVAELFANTLEGVLVRGVDHQYVGVREALSAVRGRIDIPANLVTAGLPTPIHCSYDDWSVNTWVNRVVRAALVTLLQLVHASPRATHKLRRLAAMLDGVEALRRDDLATTNALTRLNDHYAPALSLSRMILRGASITHLGGDVVASAFLVNMNDVYEDFLFGSLRSKLRGRLGVTRHDVTPLGSRGEIPGEPDLLFTRGTDPRTVFVADAKYKIAPDARGRSGDYYQLLAYCTALDLDHGMLIYCDHEGAQPAREVRVVRHGPTLETYCVSLLGSTDDIDRRVTSLAEAIQVRTHPRTDMPAVAGLTQ